MTVSMGTVFTMGTKKERVFLLKKHEIVIFILIGVIWVTMCALLLKLNEKKLEEETTGDWEDSQEMDDDAWHAALDSLEWNLILVNWENELDEDYTVPEFTQLRNGHAVDSRIYPDLQEMMDAARAAGYDPLICSSYRPWDKQQELYIKKVRSYVSEGNSWEEALDLAAGWVARPGTSEHQTGMAVDIVDAYYQLLNEEQEDRPVQQWLMDHCAEYGFILRYPENKKELTGINYEPWHYRYVGKEAAKIIMEEGICLEEYLQKYVQERTQ